MDVTINGARLNVEVLGPEDGPRPHRPPRRRGIGSLAEPRATFGPLADRFRVIVFDARGCGLSEGVGPFSHEQWAADVDGLRQWAGADRVTVAGGSYGGFIALEYAVRYPDHVDAVVLRERPPTGRTSSSPSRTPAGRRGWRSTGTTSTPLLGRHGPQRRRAQGLWRELIPLYDADYDEARSTAAVEAGIYRHEAHNACFQENFPTYDLKPDLPNLTVPVLVTVGRHDWVTPVSASETIARLVPDAELVVFENSGHSPQNEEREEFQRACARSSTAPSRRGGGVTLFVIGAGAIGGTLGAHAFRAGHDVVLVDADAEHVAAVQRDGCGSRDRSRSSPSGSRDPARDPGHRRARGRRGEEPAHRLGRRAAARPGSPPTDTSSRCRTASPPTSSSRPWPRAGAVQLHQRRGGPHGPGVVLQGNVATFRIGELDGGAITPRVRELAEVLRTPNPPTTCSGTCGARRCYGAMMWAGAVSDLPIAETLERPDTENS